jgi:hypothetical protein
MRPRAFVRVIDEEILPLSPPTRRTVNAPRVLFSATLSQWSEVEPALV